MDSLILVLGVFLISCSASGFTSASSYFSLDPASQNILEGEKATFTCKTSERVDCKSPDNFTILWMFQFVDEPDEYITVFNHVYRKHKILYNASWACPLYKLEIPHVEQSDVGTYYCRIFYTCSLCATMEHGESGKAKLRVKTASSPKSNLHQSKPPLLITPYPILDRPLEVDTTRGKFSWGHIIGATVGSFVAGCGLCVLINRVWVIYWKRGAAPTIGAPGAGLTEARSAPTMSSDKSRDDYTALNFEMKSDYVYDDVQVSSE